VAAALLEHAILQMPTQYVAHVTTTPDWGADTRHLAVGLRTVAAPRLLRRPRAICPQISRFRRLASCRGPVKWSTRTHNDQPLEGRNRKHWNARAIHPYCHVSLTRIRKLNAGQKLSTLTINRRGTWPTPHIDGNERFSVRVIFLRTTKLIV
jgi:hypothetical protein